jgi:hypothetical protein
MTDAEFATRQAALAAEIAARLAEHHRVMRARGYE